MTQMFFSILKTLNRQPSDVIDHQPELKTEEGYRYRYIPGDICTFYVRTTSHDGYMSHVDDVVRTLCVHISPGIYIYIFILLRFSARADDE